MLAGQGIEIVKDSCKDSQSDQILNIAQMSLKLLSIAEYWTFCGHYFKNTKKWSFEKVHFMN